MKEFFREAESSGDYENGESEIKRLLDIVQNELELCCEDLALRSVVIRKQRAVGLIPGGIEGRPFGTST